jgi:hypothetical protein
MAVPDCAADACTCNPGNNACYATRAAELWDPQTQRWCLMAEQSFERMYHASALLMPDGRVMSSGNGRRQGLTDWETAEFFSPPYLLRGLPRPGVSTIAGAAVPDKIPNLGWGGTLQIALDDATSFADVGRVTLVRLGSVTHQFDMGQRFIDLGCMWESIDAAGQVVVEVFEPSDANIAPPGDYMLFVLSEAGVPSDGHYVKVGT